MAALTGLDYFALYKMIDDELPTNASNLIKAINTRNVTKRMTDTIFYLAPLKIIGAAIDNPPVGPAEGDTYTIGLAPTGDWVGHAKALAVFSDAQWQFLEPSDRMRCFTIDNPEIEYTFRGTYPAGVWDASASGFTLLDGNGTTANGQAVDIGGPQTGDILIDGIGLYDFRIINLVDLDLQAVNSLTLRMPGNDEMLYITDEVILLQVDGTNYLQQHAINGATLQSSSSIALVAATTLDGSAQDIYLTASSELYWETPGGSMYSDSTGMYLEDFKSQGGHLYTDDTGMDIGSADTKFLMSLNDFTVIDDRPAPRGMEYNIDPRAGFTDLSLVHKLWVEDNFISTGGASGLEVDSTGLLSGGTLLTGGGATEYSIADGTGHLVTSTGATTQVSWTGLTNITPTNIGTQNITFVGINSVGGVVEQSAPFTSLQSRTIIVLGVIIHVDRVNVDAVNNEQHISYNAMSSLYDAMESIGFFNVAGNLFAPNGGNLSINKSSGIMFKMGSNYADDFNDPHNRPLGILSALTFQYRFSDGSNGVTGVSIDPDNLEDNAGGLVALANNKWSVQRIYSFTSNNVKIQRGTESFDTLDAAIAGRSIEDYITEPSIKANGLLRGWLYTKKGTAILANDRVNDFFEEAPKFGEGSGAAGGAGSLIVNLQVAYQNSIPDPEILTNATQGAFKIRQGSGADTDQIFVGENAAGTITWAVTGNGDVLGNTFDGRDLSVDGTKLDGIEALADVTDTANVTAAGATMDTDSSLLGNAWFLDEDNMASDDPNKAPSQQSVKAYVDNTVASAKAYQGGYDAATNTPDLDTTPIAGIKAGFVWDVTADGTFFTIAVEIGDTITATVDDPTLEAQWVVTQTNLTAASIKTQYESNLNTNAYIDADVITVGFITVTQAVDLDTMESDIALNNPKITNATHTGDVTGSGALTIAPNIVGFDKMAQIQTARFLGRNSLGSGNVESLTSTAVRLILNVEDGATADQTDAEIKTAYENNADTNAFTDAEKTLLGTVETNADVTDATNVAAAGATMDADTSVLGNAWVLDEDDMISDSNTKLATQQSIKAYVDNTVASAKAYQGGYNAATNTPDLDVTPIAGILAGFVWDVTVAGTFFTALLEAGDTLTATVDSPIAEADWVITQTNLTAASIKTQYESNADTNAYTNAAKAKVDFITVTGAVDLDTMGTVSGTGADNEVMRWDGTGNAQGSTGVSIDDTGILSVTKIQRPSDPDCYLEFYQANSLRLVTGGNVGFSASALNVKLGEGGSKDISIGVTNNETNIFSDASTGFLSIGLAEFALPSQGVHIGKIMRYDSAAHDNAATKILALDGNNDVVELTDTKLPYKAYWEAPTDADKIWLGYTDVAITFTAPRLTVSGTGGPSLTVQLKHSPDFSAAGLNLTTSSAITNTTTGQTQTISDGTVPAGSHIWAVTTAMAGTTVTDISISAPYTED